VGRAAAAARARPPIQVRSTSIPVHRQGRCMVDTSVPVQWAPDSPGSGSGTPPPFLRSQLRSGQILDVLSDVVRKNPSWFRWIERDVSAADVERMERHEHEGGEWMAIIKPSAPKVAPSVKLQPKPTFVPAPPVKMVPVPSRKKR
jgi:hypothetical protein